MAQDVHVPALFTLTDITGARRNEGREIVSRSGLVIERRTFVLLITGTLVAAPVAALFASLLGIWALLVYAAVMIAWFWGWHVGSTGLRIAAGRSVWDRLRSEAGTTTQCGRRITPDMFEQVLLVHASTPAQVRAPDLEELFALPGADSPTPAPIATGTPPLPTRAHLAPSVATILDLE